MSEHTHLAVSGLSLRVRSALRDDASQLLLTNAWPQSIRCWDDQWDALAERFSLLAVDLPGFGRSEGRRSAMTPTAQAEILAQLVRRLDRGPVTLVAPDVGVPAAFALALDHPDALDGLVTFNGPAHHPPGMSFELALLGRSRAVRATMRYGGALFALVAFQRGYERHRLARSARREYLGIAASPRRFGLQLDYQASYATELPRIQAALSEIEVPVLLPWGVEDPFIRLGEGERIAEALPNATWEPLAGCGHFAHEDAGARFVELLGAWHAASVVRAPA